MSQAAHHVTYVSGRSHTSKYAAISLFPFSGISLKKSSCQPFVNFTIGRMSTATASELIWTFLSDPARKVQKDLDIAEYTDPEHNPMIPHVIVLEPGLVICKIYNSYWFFGRPTIEELRQDLRAVLKKCRPDWDITRPELKATWERSERNRFYPYGKTYGQVFREQEKR